MARLSGCCAPLLIQARGQVVDTCIFAAQRHREQEHTPYFLTKTADEQMIRAWSEPRAC